MGQRVAIIGGGAAGMMAAITAAAAGGTVTVYEKNDRIGKKILMTGNGKCNLGNMEMGITNYNSRHPELVKRILDRFSVMDTMAFFESAGMMVKEKFGLLYPASEQASTVLDILRIRLKEQQVETVCDCEVTRIESGKNGKLWVTAPSGVTEYDRVIIACGSRASLKSGAAFGGYRLAESLGHHIVPVVPALVQLKCEEKFMKALAGVRCQVMLTLWIDGECCRAEWGELQLTDYGISGIPVFQLSRTAAYALPETGRGGAVSGSGGREVVALADFLPEYGEAAYEALIRKRYAAGSHKTLADFLLGLANKKINQVMIQKAGLKGTDEVAGLGEAKIRDLLWDYRKLKLHITGVNSFEQAQVCAGGIDLRELSEHLESLLVPGVYFAGEIVDVDGRCGGYNLQWAWSSGYAAGRHAAGCSSDLS